jgi:hypothetical protein
MALFDLEQRVVVQVNARTETAGTAGWHGRVVGKSYENDDPSGPVLAYAVAIDEDGERVWMIDPEDLEREAR